MEEGTCWYLESCVSRGGESTGGAAPVSTSRYPRAPLFPSGGIPCGAEEASKAAPNSPREENQMLLAEEQGHPG